MAPADELEAVIIKCRALSSAHDRSHFAGVMKAGRLRFTGRMSVTFHTDRLWQSNTAW